MLRRVNEPATPSNPIVLFDGVCNLCNASVQWIVRRDRAARFRFAALQSAAGRAALAATGPLDTQPDSVVLIHEGRRHLRTDAALHIARLLGFPWSLCAIFLLVPRFLRDPAYRLIARHRYRWFGKSESCMVPTPALRARFLDADEAR